MGVSGFGFRCLGGIGVRGVNPDRKPETCAAAKGEQDEEEEQDLESAMLEGSAGLAKSEIKRLTMVVLDSGRVCKTRHASRVIEPYIC